MGWGLGLCLEPFHSSSGTGSEGAHLGHGRGGQDSPVPMGVGRGAMDASGSFAAAQKGLPCQRVAGRSAVEKT